ncbi:SDR family NAD(P)-dependent oxidoreductase [Nocardia jiangxiensis]|uniref:SDR family NAD(P)-dependent oxidoreductase n=1 Tax=Nocardia jiangxiensis TaxID=282685 RepID=A0ABW6SF89_9NOCA|nr:SDR family NAD(P)-dependent oxidoreductase [Nocardia jiangxiensis]
MTFQNKRIVVTGAGGGIGHATALHLARQGASVLCTDVDGEGLERTRKELQEAAPSVRVASEVLDSSDETAAAAVLSRYAETWGGPFDALANVAGVILAKPLADCELADLERLMRINVGGAFVMSRSILPHLAPQAVIVNVSSSSAGQMTPGLGLYGASKAANLFLTKALAVELAERGVRVCAIAPGAVDTAMPRRCMPPGEEGERMLAQAVDGAQLIKTLAKPAEVAAAIAFLLGDNAGYVTGSTLWFDGGMPH